MSLQCGFYVFALLLFIRTNNKTQKLVTSLSDLKCRSRTEVQNKSTCSPVTLFFLFTGLFFSYYQVIAFEKQAGKFYWMVIATLWLDITCTHVYTHMCMCVCIDTHTFIYLCICTSICVCVWYSLLLNCFGKMAPLCCFQIPVDISRMPMDEYSRRELLLFFPWEFSVIFLEYAEASPTAVLLL